MQEATTALPQLDINALILASGFLTWLVTEMVKKANGMAGDSTARKTMLRTVAAVCSALAGIFAAAAAAIAALADGGLTFALLHAVGVALYSAAGTFGFSQTIHRLKDWLLPKKP